MVMRLNGRSGEERTNNVRIIFGDSEDTITKPADQVDIEWLGREVERRDWGKVSIFINDNEIENAEDFEVQDGDVVKVNPYDEFGA